MRQSYSLVIRRTLFLSLALLSLMLTTSLLSLDPIPAPYNHGSVRVRHLHNTDAADRNGYQDNSDTDYSDSVQIHDTSDVDKYIDSAKTFRTTINRTNDAEGIWSIPHIIHQAWDDANVPSQVTSWLSSWLTVHPHWQHWFWTEAHSTRLIGRKYPHYLHLYDQYPYKINRADVRRYFIMYEYGGVYADLDVESVRQLDGVLERYPCIIAQEPLVHQVLLYGNNASNFAMPAFMACRPRHPFFKLLIDSLHESISLAWSLPWNDNILQSTGPHYVARVLERYRFNNSADSVYLAPWQWFMPDYDSTNLSAFLNICNNNSKYNSNNVNNNGNNDRNNVNNKNNKVNNINNNVNRKNVNEITNNDTNKTKKDTNLISAACKLLHKGNTGSSNKTSLRAVTQPVYTRHHWLHTWSSMFSTNATTHVQQINRNIHLASVT